MEFSLIVNARVFAVGRNVGRERAHAVGQAGDLRLSLRRKVDAVQIVVAVDRAPRDAALNDHAATRRQPREPHPAVEAQDLVRLVPRAARRRHHVARVVLAVVVLPDDRSIGREARIGVELAGRGELPSLDRAAAQDHVALQAIAAPQLRQPVGVELIVVLAGRVLDRAIQAVRNRLAAIFARDLRQNIVAVAIGQVLEEVRAVEVDRVAVGPEVRGWP